MLKFCQKDIICFCVIVFFAWQAERRCPMIKITSTMIVHRPERVLYYLPEITEEVNQSISDGMCPMALTEY